MSVVTITIPKIDGISPTELKKNIDYVSMQNTCSSAINILVCKLRTGSLDIKQKKAELFVSKYNK